MNPRFSREVQKTTIRLLQQLAAVYQMRNVGVRIKDDDPAMPIELYSKTKKIENNETVEEWHFCTTLSIPVFLSRYGRWR